MQVLEELYLGGIRPGERIGKRNRQYEKALENTIKVGDALTASLTPEQKELFAIAFTCTQRKHDSDKQEIEK